MERLLNLFRPHRHIYLPGATGEVLALADALRADPKRLAGVKLTSCLLPGFNSFDYAALHRTASLETFLMPPALRQSFAAGRTRITPLPYSAIARHIEASGFDIGIFHVAPPDENGMCSLGICADFAPHAWRTAQTRVLIVNPDMPSLHAGPCFDIRDADLTFEIESKLITGGEERADPAIDTIAFAVAALVPDSATVQLGIGGVPGAMWRHLASHRDLTIGSGLVTAGWRILRDSGALRAGQCHRAGVALGNLDFYMELAREDWLRMAPVGETHDVQALGGIERFVAINSALEVDLFGQANLEWRGGRLVSGVGGALDFSRGAMASPGGRAIIALPATAANGSISRIVPRVTAPTASLSRDDVDTVVTEFGVAELRGKSLGERAEAMTKVAAPEHRDALSRGWRDMIRAI